MLRLLSKKTLATAAAEKTHRGYTLYPQLVDSECVKNLLDEARQTQAWAKIFNRNNRRSVAAAGAVGQEVALKIHRFLIQDACILDLFQHDVRLIQHSSKTASYLRSLPGCAEQAEHRDFRHWNCTVQSRMKPCSCIIFLQDATETSGSRLKFWTVDAQGKVCSHIVHGRAGDLLVFAGDIFYCLTSSTYRFNSAMSRRRVHIFLQAMLFITEWIPMMKTTGYFFTARQEKIRFRGAPNRRMSKIKSKTKNYIGNFMVHFISALDFNTLTDIILPQK